MRPFKSFEMSKHTSIHLKEQLNKVALWLYSDLSNNIRLYERLFNDILFSKLKDSGTLDKSSSTGVGGRVHINIIANNSVDVHIVSNSSYPHKRITNLLYFRDPSFVDSHNLVGDYCSVDSLFESLLLKDDSSSYDTICNYGWVLSQSREYKLDTLLREQEVTI